MAQNCGEIFLYEASDPTTREPRLDHTSSKILTIVVIFDTHIAHSRQDTCNKAEPRQKAFRDVVTDVALGVSRYALYLRQLS